RDLQGNIEIIRCGAPRPENIEAVIARHCHKPADWTGGARNKAICALPDFYVDFLDCLFGFRAVLQDTQGDAKKFRACALIELAKGRSIPDCAARNKIGDLLGWTGWHDHGAASPPWRLQNATK